MNAGKFEVEHEGTEFTAEVGLNDVVWLEMYDGWEHWTVPINLDQVRGLISVLEYADTWHQDEEEA